MFRTPWNKNIFRSIWGGAYEIKSLFYLDPQIIKCYLKHGGCVMVPLEQRSSTPGPWPGASLWACQNWAADMDFRPPVCRQWACYTCMGGCHARGGCLTLMQGVCCVCGGHVMLVAGVSRLCRGCVAPTTLAPLHEHDNPPTHGAHSPQPVHSLKKVGDHCSRANVCT